MVREVQGGHLNESAVKPVDHYEQSLIGHGWYVNLRACGDAVAPADGQNIAQPRYERGSIQLLWY